MFNVVFASSNEYSSFLLIALTSLLENNKSDFDCINIYILDDGISVDKKNRINELSDKYPCQITFIELNILHSSDIDLMPIQLKSSTNSLTTYSRLFISKLLPKHINKVLYLDCDALILGSYKELWDLDISDYYCAAVLETINDTVKKLFWYLDFDSYFNAGFLLINLEKWRNDNVEVKFAEFLSKNYGKFFVADQGVINNVFEHKIKIVEPKYNLINYFQYYDYDLAKKCCAIENEYYTKEIVDESRENPVFVHFTGGGYSAPWHNKDHKYHSQFFKYAKMANCEEVINYLDPPTFKAKLFFKGINSNLFKFFLKLIPKIIINNYVNKRLIFHFEYAERIADEQFNK